MQWQPTAYPAVGCHYFPPGLRLPPQPQSITALWPVRSYTAWWQRHIGVNNLPKVVMRRCLEQDLNPRRTDHKSNALPLHHRVTCHVVIFNYAVSTSWTAHCILACSEFGCMLRMSPVDATEQLRLSWMYIVQFYFEQKVDVIAVFCYDCLLRHFEHKFFKC